MMQYHTGNLEKYQSLNPLKRAMVYKLNRKILSVVSKVVGGGTRKYRILDAGCGEGFISALLCKEFSNVSITGLEQSQQALAVAHMHRMNGKVCFRQGDIYQMPFENGSFDLVVCTEVLEHLERPKDALKEINRVVKEEGAVLLTVPSEPWFCMGNMLAFKNITRFGNPKDHINHWTYQGIINEVRTFLINGSIACRLQAWPSFPWSVVLYTKKPGKIVK